MACKDRAGHPVAGASRLCGDAQQSLRHAGPAAASQFKQLLRLPEKSCCVSTPAASVPVCKGGFMSDTHCAAGCSKVHEWTLRVRRVALLQHGFRMTLGLEKEHLEMSNEGGSACSAY